MSEFRKMLQDTAQDMKDGKLPTDTGREIHLTGHRIVMDKFAEVKQEEQNKDRKARQLWEDIISRKKKKEDK